MSKSNREHRFNSLMMPFGKYHATNLANVPDDYLYWLYKNLKVHQQQLHKIVETLLKERGHSLK